MAYQRGDIVLVPIPFTDLSRHPVRPGVVLTSPRFETSTGDIIVAALTSQPHDLPTDYELKDWRQAGLTRPSWARARLATLQANLVQFSPGRLSVRDFSEVEQRVRSAMASS